MEYRLVSFWKSNDYVHTTMQKRVDHQKQPTDNPQPKSPLQKITDRLLLKILKKVPDESAVRRKLVKDRLGIDVKRNQK
ncbi:hypothetical protein Mal48_39060 [Thalassoglobus polymorphus]|uniref:Uncharacterized protein n=1 Tax=Thalassoglobus polymorphus TaxID=2527994 RepID=A0A517QSN0_9PLAN|nr:hypothetical protein Mal48_39060 [Thalassoglobus polymorphus]